MTPRRALTLLVVGLLLVAAPAAANTGNCSVFRSWSTGDTLTAGDLSQSFTTVGVTNMNTDCLAGYAASAAQMQATSDPFAGGAASTTTSLTGELQRLRFVLAKLTGWTYWYQHTDRIALPTENLLTNADVETWSAGASAAPDSWTQTGAGGTVARDGTNVKHGTYAAAVTRAGTDTYLSQNAATISGQGPIGWWQGKTVTLAAWTRATVVARARLCLNDGVGTTCSSYHSGGSSFEYLTATRTLDGAATKVEARLQVDTGDTTAQYDGVGLYLGQTATDYRAPTPAPSALPRSYLVGYTLANNAVAKKIDIAAGAARDSTDATDLKLGAAITAKDLSVAWAVGSTQGCLGSGSAAYAGNLWLHVYAVIRIDTAVVDVLCTTETTPTLPANYTKFRRLGSIRTNAGGTDNLAFTQDGDLFEWATPVLDADVSNPGITAVTRTLTVPTGVNVWAIYNAGQDTSTASPTAAYLSDLATTDVAPSTTAAPLGQLGTLNANTYFFFGQLITRTNTLGQIRSRLSGSDANTKLRIATLGWIDWRGRNN